MVELTDLGLKVLTVSGDIDLTTADGVFRGQMLESVDEFEARRKGERQARANEDRAEKGQLFKGRVRLTGYTRDGDIISEESVLVRDIFSRFPAAALSPRAFVTYSHCSMRGSY